MRDLDYTGSVAFLSKFFALSEDLVELRCILNDGGGVRDRTFIGQGQAANIISFCQINDVPGRAVYFGCSTRRQGSRQGRKEDLSEIVCAHVDIDCYKPGLELSVEEVVAALMGCGNATRRYPPSLIVASGWGVHAYWLLREASPAGDGLDDLEIVLRRLAEVFAGDPLPAQAAAIMRLPGTHNSKKGEWRECVVLEDGERLYELSDLAEMLDGLGPQLIPAGIAPAAGTAGADPFLDFSAIMKMDIEGELASMQLHDPESKGLGVHRIRTRAAASLVARGHEDEAIFQRLMAETERAVVEGGEAWSPSRMRLEARKLRDEIRSAHAKGWAPKMAPEVELPEGVVRLTPRQQERPDDDPLPARPSITRPTIPVRAGHLSELADTGERLLVDMAAPVYRRTSKLMRPVVEEDDAADGLKTKVARLVEVSGVFLVDYLGRLANWIKYDKRSGKWGACDPPKDVAATVLAREGEWTLPAVAGVITTPTLRPDGSVLTVEGYDAATRLILLSPPALPIIPPQPTRSDALAALALLEGLLTEFCFIDEPSRSVALSALITPVIRGALPVVPAHVMRAPVAGSGKSYLVDIASVISTGQRCPVISSGKSEEELEKRIGAVLLGGQAIVSIDNLNGELRGDALCQMVERPVVQIRILGKSELMRIETRATLFATGNNIVVVGDMVRRTLLASMDANVERPELREFQHSPLDMVLADRGRYIAACLTIVRAYLCAGSPGLLAPLASYEKWSALVRSAIVWLGKADPVDSMETTRSEDPELSALRDVVNGWSNAGGLNTPRTAREIIALSATRDTETIDNNGYMQVIDKGPKYPEFAEALEVVAAGKGGVDARAFGKWLVRQKNRVIDGFKIEDQTDAKLKIKQWRLVIPPKTVNGR